MPLYEYRCEGCGEMEEKLQSIHAPEAHDCPKCGRLVGMKRQVSTVSFSLVGGGWYKSEYSKKTGSSSPESTSGSGADNAGSGGCCGGCACHK